MTAEPSGFARGYPDCMAKEARSANIMRQNLKELNRSMESIEKMIEKSRRIISQSRDSFASSLEKPTHKKIATIAIPHQESSRALKPKTNYRKINFFPNQQSPAIHPPAELSVREDNKASNRYQTITKAPQIQKANALESTGQGCEIQEYEHKSKDKESASPYKQYFDQGRTIYKFSPQRTNNLQSNALQNRQPSAENPNQRFLSFSKDINQQEFIAESKPTTNHKENILIEEEEETHPNTTAVEREYGGPPRFKTDYTTEDEIDVFQMYKLQQPSSHTEFNSDKKKINLKLFQSENKKPAIISERSKKSNLDSVKISARKNLVKELEELETKSTTEEERKAKFILKIKKYGFVEKHLSQQEIWDIYDELVRRGVPELKWPIVIVDEVYQKMKQYK